MTVREPSATDISDIAASFGMKLSPADADSFLGLMQGVLASYRRVDELAEPKPVVRYPRGPGHRPEPRDNPLNAWAWRTDVRGATDPPCRCNLLKIPETG
jgi:amidase